MSNLARSRRLHWWLLFAAAAGLLLFGLVQAGRRGGEETVDPEPRRATPSRADRAGYAEPSACATCHQAIAERYALTGMGRSFARVDAATLPDSATSGRFDHAASDRHYVVTTGDGGLVQRRHQVTAEGRETNVFSLSADYVMGSGNHARTFIHRAPDGRLLQLPLSWYAERGGHWAMSPGYDRATQPDFRRVVDEGCMSCHNGYPRESVTDEGLGPRFTGLPQGIDCQRCHGPGQRHIDAITAGDDAAARQAIVNPGRLDRERQLEVCLQCHLEPTSSPLPFQLRRVDKPALSYVPGTPLADTFLFFDHAAPAAQADAHADKFEIAGAAYRLAKSACFQGSQMTCVTCHNPHDVPRGQAAVQHYTAACRSCHQTVHAAGPPRVAGSGPRDTCMDCHMPRRRTDDAVHVVMTDHFIQRKRPPRDLTAPLQESVTLAASHYRGEVELYYPATLPPTPENELYLALAQVQQGANLTAGIPRLEAAIQRHGAAPIEFLYELARAYVKAGKPAEVIRWSEAALLRDATFAPALKELAGAATTLGQWDRAVQALGRAVELRPGDAHALADLGNVYLQQQRLPEAIAAVQRALAIDPAAPQAINTLGLARLAQGDAGGAEQQFREAIRVQPDLAAAHHNLANVLAGRQAYADAATHFALAVEHDPNHAAAHHGLGLMLALTGQDTRALASLQAAARLEPRRERIHMDIADVLASMGRTREAIDAYRAALGARPDDFEAHFGLAELLAGQNRMTEAVPHFRAAAGSPDPALRAAAEARLSGRR
ncbi:MAG: tetratricopeptide repeat protein [Acidobacteria bacterium]|nr:tetratricopeptide repeat protein [Acidobacteriota bacterium]